MTLASNNVAIRVVTPQPLTIEETAPAAEPLIAITSIAIPATVVPEAFPQPKEILAPSETGEVPIADELAPLPAPPFKRTGDLASLVAQFRGSDPGSRELECLAVRIYFESKSEPLAGQLAVGEVIANRANSRGRFPSSYCGVLFQRSQFSFIRVLGLPAHWVLPPPQSGCRAADDT